MLSLPTIQHLKAHGWTQEPDSLVWTKEDRKVWPSTVHGFVIYQHGPDAPPRRVAVRDFKCFT